MSRRALRRRLALLADRAALLEALARIGRTPPGPSAEGWTPTVYQRPRGEPLDLAAIERLRRDCGDP